MKFRVSVLLLMVASAASAIAEKPKEIEKRLKKQLVDRMIVLKVPRVGNNLKFEATGETISAEGIRGFDDKVKVTKVKLGKDELVLKGFRLHDAYSPATDSVEVINILDPLEIHLALQDPTSEAAISAAYNKVFKSSAEIAERKCSDYTYVGRFYREGELKTGIKGVCLPSGVQAMTAPASAPGMTPVKAISDPDPSYPPDETNPKSQGQTSTLIRIDESGRVTDGIVLRATKENFARQSTKAFNGWRFKPAERNGRPIASIVVIEMKFQRY